MPNESLRVALFNGSAYIAADYVAGVYYPVSKLDVGADGASSGVTASGGMPVSVLSSGYFSTSAYQSQELVQLQTIATAIQAATPAGNNNIGDVDIASIPSTAASSAYQSLQLAQLIALASAYTGGYLQVNLVTSLSDTIDSAMVSPRRPSSSTDKWVAFSSNATAYAAGSAQQLISTTTGKTLFIKDITLSSKGTVAGKAILYFAAAGDTTYSAGTDKPLEIQNFAPSASAYPGSVKAYHIPVGATATGHGLWYQCSTALDIDITVHGYEV